MKLDLSIAPSDYSPIEIGVSHTSMISLSPDFLAFVSREPVNVPNDFCRLERNRLFECTITTGTLNR